jgi:hypothetical protein
MVFRTDAFDNSHTPRHQPNICILHAVISSQSPPLAFAEDTYAFALPRNADSLHDFGRFCPPLLLHDIAFCAPFCE